MTYRDDPVKQEIRQRLKEYLGQKGIDTSRNFRCLSGKHEDVHPSMSLIKPDETVAYCHSCHSSMDIFNFIEHFENIQGFKDQIEWAKDHFSIQGQPTGEKGPHKMPNKPRKNEKGIKAQEAASRASEGIYEPVGGIVDFEPLIRAWHEQIGATDYHRSLSERTIKEYRLGYDPDFIYRGKTKGKEWSLKAGPCLMIPFPGVNYYMARPLKPGEYETGEDKKYLKPQGPGQPLFNERWLRDPDDEPLFIVEGPFDALSIEDVGFQAVALAGTGTTRLKDMIKEAIEKKPGKVYILSLDNDKPDKDGKRAGLIAMDKLEPELVALGARVYRARKEENGDLIREGIEGKYKDANEALTENRQGFEVAVARAWEDAWRYGKELDKKIKEDFEKSSTLAYIEAIRQEIRESEKLPALETGFSRLDSLLEGGLQEGLYVLGAITGAGKTTLALQIGDHVAKNGTDVIIFSLEMGRKELMAKSVSRLTYEIDENYSKTTPGIMSGRRYANYTEQDMKVIEDAWKQYSEYAGRIYIHPGVGDMSPQFMSDKVKDHIKLSDCKHPLVIIDYLQITSSEEDRLTDKQRIDRAVIEIKRMSRDLHIPVLVVSSFNRSGYNEAVAMESMKETGAIEYSCDVLMGLGLTAVEAVDDEGEKTRKKAIAEAKRKARKDRDKTGDLKLSLVVLKNRNGKTGEVPLIFHTTNNHFRSV